jgi:hypothetical protein
VRETAAVRDKRIAGGLALILVAFAAAVIASQTNAIPDVVVGVLFYGGLLVGGVLVVRGWKARYGRDFPPPLQPGESYDRPVTLTVVENVPLAEMWRQRLRREGIEAVVDGALRVPFAPVLLLVGEHDLDRARELFPELRQ